MSEAKPAEKIEVFLVAENRLLREALGKILSRKSDLNVVAALECGTHICAQIAELKPHVLVLDSAVFACSELQLVNAGRRAVPGLKIVMIGMNSDKDIFLRCVRAGVTGYVLKDASALEVAAAVRSVAYDGAVCPPSLCMALFESVVAQEQRFPYYLGHTKYGLTRREQQLVGMISHGLSNKEIASQIGVSEQTVKNHVHRLLQKLGATDRLNAVEICRMDVSGAQSLVSPFDYD